VTIHERRGSRRFGLHRFVGMVRVLRQLHREGDLTEKEVLHVLGTTGTGQRERPGAEVCCFSFLASGLPLVIKNGFAFVPH
jgi:hypothetical protein